MPKPRPEIPREEVEHQLWRKYERSHEFKVSKRKHSISSVHPLIEQAEKTGLGRIVHQFVAKLLQTPGLRKAYEARESDEWTAEWCAMQELLFRLVYRNRGKLRKKGQDVTFGDPGDEDLYKIPLGGGPTVTETLILAKQVTEELPYVKVDEIESVCTYLARTHYGFIRVHPFPDGNGRIARALTDQLAVSLGYPPIIAGFPRLNIDKKKGYHAAIKGCIGDPSCRSLKQWIQNQIETKLAEIA